MTAIVGINFFPYLVVGNFIIVKKLYHVRLNTYTLEEVRQKTEGRRQKERKG
ncbi:MAG: hypothetical protein F6K54_34850 [Okeania sp. SIO3B5]|uniref:hypothetical protein n=1 Tax=Okeania sp. SIO3B5 TaxID=2607811 RepID=UPI0013FF6F79|nr:hypothetical protein [Okeania sp. SIO3B5]NEO57789.1 hypothetical protein [Okeania sp. SIO3B5]